MILLRRVIGDALRARRQAQQRTLRDVSTAANVSLGYLSEVERGQKEASSELLAAICEALGARLSEVLREISLTVEGAEQVPASPHRAATLATVPAAPERGDAPGDEPAGDLDPADAPAATGELDPAGELDPVARHREPVAGESSTVQAPSMSPVGSEVVVDGTVAVTVRRDTPLRTTLRANRPRRRDEVLSVA